MSAADTGMTSDGIRAELIGLGTLEIDQNGYIVANRQRHGHVSNTRVGEFLRRAPEYIEFLLRELDRVTRTDDDDFATEHARAVGDVSKEH